MLQKIAVIFIFSINKGEKTLLLLLRSHHILSIHPLQRLINDRGKGKKRNSGRQREKEVVKKYRLGFYMHKKFSLGLREEERQGLTREEAPKQEHRPKMQLSMFSSLHDARMPILKKGKK